MIYSPQYSLRVFERTHLQFNLETEDDYEVMLMLYQKSRESDDVMFQNFLANSNQGFYVKGFGFTEMVLEPMEYTLVISSKVQFNVQVH